MDDLKLGRVFRAVRIRRGLRQCDVGVLAGVSNSVVSRIERGQLDELTVAALRRVGAALEIRMDQRPTWRGGELDRLLNSAHSALAEQVTRWLDQTGWDVRPEVSFSRFGERGIIDLLAWHARTRTLLVTELKTDIADVNELLGTVDRKRRLGAQVAREQFGWDPEVVASWLVVSATRTNRRRIDAHASLFRSAFPLRGRTMARWLRKPAGPAAGLSMWPDSRPATTRPPIASVRRVRAASPGSRERGSRSIGRAGGAAGAGTGA